MYILGKLGEPLSKATKGGIIKLELAYSKTRVIKTIDAWSAASTAENDNIAIAKKSIWLDFIFIFFYSGFLFLASKAISRSFGGKFGRAGKWIATAALLAGSMNVFENCGILISLSMKTSDVTAFATAFCSSIKWILVTLAVLYVLTGSVGLIRAKIVR